MCIRDSPWRSYIGRKLNQPYGLIADRFFIDEEDVNNSPKQSFGPYAAGDIKYLDINGDGQINIEDQVPIGFPTVPEIIYGTGFSFGFGNVDLSCFFQGSARSSFFIRPDLITPFINKGQRALLQYIADDHWSETNRNLRAFWPRLSENNIQNNNQLSTCLLYTSRRRYRPYYYAPLATTDGSYRLMNFNPDTGTEYLDFEDGGKNIISTMYGEMRVGYNRTFNDLHDINAVPVSYTHLDVYKRQV